MPRGRPPKIVEYKNVTKGTSNELMILEIYGEEDEKHVVKVKPGDTVYLSQRDIRAHRNDKRFLEGRIVPVDSEGDVKSTFEATDIMSDERIVWFVKNTNTVEEVRDRIKNLRNRVTIERILKEAKKEENEKTYAFVSAIEEKLTEIVKLEEGIVYDKSDVDKNDENVGV